MAKDTGKEGKQAPEPRHENDILITPFGKNGNYRLRICIVDQKDKGMAGQIVELYNHTQNAKFPFVTTPKTNSSGVTFTKLQFSEPSLEVQFVCGTVTEIHSYVGSKQQRELTEKEKSLPWWKFLWTMVFGKGGN